MPEKKVRAAIYTRVSTAAQDPEPQLAALREYVKQRGFVLHKEYVDRVTGDFAKRKKKNKDLAYQELMADVDKRLVDCVIVWKFDRFARSLNVLINALEHFKSVGVDFIIYTQSIDTTTAMGRLFYNIIGSFSDFKRELVVERVNAGLANAKLAEYAGPGRWNDPDYLIIGYAGRPRQREDPPSKVELSADDVARVEATF